MSELMYNYYFDTEDPARPFTRRTLCNALSLVPDNATRLVPPEPDEGLAACWSGSEWILRHDWRQEELYCTKTGKLTQYPTVDIDLDSFNTDYTECKPTSSFDVWDKNKKQWVKDEAAEEEFLIAQHLKTKRSLINDASEQVDLIKEIIYFKEDEGEDITEINELYTQWRKYRTKLLVLKITSDTVFPTPPKTLEDIYG